MKVVITGGRGFLGKHLLRRFHRDGIDVTSFVRPGSTQLQSFEQEVDFLDEHSVAHSLARANPDFLLYAARARPLPSGPDSLEASFDNEVRAHVNFCRGLRGLNSIAIFLGSTDEYGGSKSPFRETDIQACFSQYSWTKIVTFQTVRWMLTELEIPWVWLRPSILYGPGQTGGMLIPSIIEAAKKSSTVALTPGEQLRDFVYVEDCVSQIMQVLRSPERAINQALNIANGSPTSVREVGETLNSIAGLAAHLDWGALQYRPQENMELYPSGERFISLYGSHHTTSVEAGLRATWQLHDFCLGELIPTDLPDVR